MQKVRKVTIKEIAKVCNVSPATVSLVLNGKTEEISKKTAEKVREAAAELNYSTNIVAKSLVTNKSNTLAIIVPDITNMFYVSIIKAINKAAMAEGYSLILCDTENSFENEIKQLNLLDNRLIDGILIASRNSKKLLNDYPNIRSLPIVVLDEELKPTQDYIYTVASDNRTAAYKITELLIKKKHTAFFCLTGMEDSTNSVFRTEGVKEALEKYGIPYKEEDFVSGDYKYERAYEEVKALKEINFTALICFNDLMAYGAMEAFREKGIKVPEDVSIVSFDTRNNHKLIKNLSGIELTSVNQDETEIGNVAIHTLFNAIDGKEVAEQVHLLPYHINEGNTVFEPKTF